MAQAQYVCANCKRRKKRCDKLLPHCTQCKELRAECIYSCYPETTEDMQSIQSRLMRLESFLPHSRGFGAAFSGPDNNISCLPHSQVRPPSPPTPPTSKSSDDPLSSSQKYLASLIDSICHSEAAECTEEDICSTYFTHINKWLPIISQKKFHSQLNSLAPRRPETNLLLTCMYLLVREPCPVGPNGEMDKYHKGARHSYFSLQADYPVSIDLAQCGLLLATYEHASGLVEQAYSTIWTCAGMMYSLRLQDKYLLNSECDDEQINCAEGHSLWWGILIRDRFINLEDQMRDRPLATRAPRLNDYMPVNIDAWESSPSTVPLLERRICDNNSGPLSGYSFSREAQACYLLGETLNIALTAPETSELQMITVKLQDFLSRLMSPTSGTWGTFCGATSMTISSMYRLYSNYSPGEDIITAQAKPHISPDAIFVLPAMTQIVIDIADAFNEMFLTFNLTAIAPSYPYIMYRGGMQVLMSGNFPNEKAERNFNAIRKCCWYFSHRWLIAVTYLATLEAAAIDLGVTLPSLGTFVKPNGITPGLC
ncbi:hypothetical protein V490_06225 [Pseudogymnoascus sp. VKM F-3557]|nr:hypothetical protein V490_06225 [Pseudogymnoascus sp. VKM F-3557]